MGATLYELGADYAAVIGAYDQAETEDEREAALERLLELGTAIEDKAECYARVMRNYQAEAEGLKVEIDRLTSKRRAAEHAVDRMKSAMLDAMKLTNCADIATTIGKWRTQMNPPSVTVLDDAAVPQEWHIPQPDKIDKAGLIKNFKATGEIVEGVEITQTLGIRFR